MQILENKKDRLILRFDASEELRAGIHTVAGKYGISSGWVQALGSCGELELAYYNLDTKKYETRRYTERMEVLTATGNIALKDDKPFAHLHGTFSDKGMAVFGGHINKCVVSATMEVMIWKGEGKLRRLHDEETGLFLLQKK